MHATRLVVLLTAIFAVLGVITPASAVTSPSCGITWGSQPKWEADQGETEVLIGVRAGRHACFDRLVLDLGWSDNEFSAYDVRYVDVVQHDGSGEPVPVRGGAVLQVSVGAPAYDEYGDPTVPLGREMVDVGGFDTFRQVASAGSFEGWTTLALGVRARLPFRVFLVKGAPFSDQALRLVLDVAHHW